MKARSGLVWFLLVLCTVIAFGALSLAQIRPDWMSETFQNMDFSKGKIGEMPPGWNLGPLNSPMWLAQLVGADACNGGTQCAMVKSLGVAKGKCFLYENVDAAPYRQKRVKFRAAVRADVPKGSYANLIVRVHRMDDSTSFYYDMEDRPITSKEWKYYEIVAPVDKEGRDVELGLQLHGVGAAWIDRIFLNVYGGQ
jgi:hypothetical protein